MLLIRYLFLLLTGRKLSTYLQHLNEFWFRRQAFTDFPFGRQTFMGFWIYIQRTSDLHGILCFTGRSSSRPSLNFEFHMRPSLNFKSHKTKARQIFMTELTEVDEAQRHYQPARLPICAVVHA